RQTDTGDDSHGCHGRLRASGAPGRIRGAHLSIGWVRHCRRVRGASTVRDLDHRKQPDVAPVTETVVVVGKTSDSAGSSSHVSPPSAVKPVPVHDRDSVCGRSKPGAAPQSFGTIRSRREPARERYATDDELVIDGGTLDGLEVGQNVV